MWRICKHHAETNQAINHRSRINPAQLAKSVRCFLSILAPFCDNESGQIERWRQRRKWYRQVWEKFMRTAGHFSYSTKLISPREFIKIFQTESHLAAVTAACTSNLITQTAQNRCGWEANNAATTTWHAWCSRINRSDDGVQPGSDIPSVLVGNPSTKHF